MVEYELMLVAKMVAVIIVDGYWDFPREYSSSVFILVALYNPMNRQPTKYRKINKISIKLNIVMILPHFSGH